MADSELEEIDVSAGTLSVVDPSEDTCVDVLEGAESVAEDSSVAMFAEGPGCSFVL